MDAVTAQLDAMTSHVSGMQAQQEEAKRRRAYPQDNGGVSARERRKLKKKEAAQAEADAEAEAAALLARARRLVDAAKGIELPDFSTLFNRCVAVRGAPLRAPAGCGRSSESRPLTHVRSGGFRPPLQEWSRRVWRASHAPALHAQVYEGVAHCSWTHRAWHTAHRAVTGQRVRAARRAHQPDSSGTSQRERWEQPAAQWGG